MTRVLALTLLAACSGETGVLDVSLTTAPGSTVLDGVQTLRMEITEPRKVVMAERTSSGFDLSIELSSEGSTAALLVDGFDATGNLIASGASPRFVFGAVTGRIVIYMAEPNSVGVAPTSLRAARSELGTGLLPYGAILVGGRIAGGAASDAVEIYNAFDHTLVAGLPLPAPRAAPAIGVGTLGVYIFGGFGEAGTASATLWRFDVDAQPSGSYLDFGDKTGFARGGETFVPIGNETFLVTGAPAAAFSGLDGSLAMREDIAALPPAAVTVVGNDGVSTSMFVGATTIIRLRGSQFETLAAPGRPDARAVTLPGGKVGVVCGSTDALRIDAATGTAETFAGIPSATKSGCAAAATSRHLVIAGGTTTAGVDGAIEIYDAATLAPVATATLAVPRTGAVALALPNDQILIAGGVDATGSPVATLELFTPTSR